MNWKFCTTPTLCNTTVSHFDLAFWRMPDVAECSDVKRTNKSVIYIIFSKGYMCSKHHVHCTWAFIVIQMPKFLWLSRQRANKWINANGLIGEKPVPFSKPLSEEKYSFHIPWKNGNFSHTKVTNVFLIKYHKKRVHMIQIKAMQVPRWSLMLFGRGGEKDDCIVIEGLIHKSKLRRAKVPHEREKKWQSVEGGFQKSSEWPNSMWHTPQTQTEWENAWKQNWRPGNGVNGLQINRMECLQCMHIAAYALEKKRALANKTQTVENIPHLSAIYTFILSLLTAQLAKQVSLEI